MTDVADNCYTRMTDVADNCYTKSDRGSERSREFVGKSVKNPLRFVESVKTPLRFVECHAPSSLP